MPAELYKVEAVVQCVAQGDLECVLRALASYCDVDASLMDVLVSSRVNNGRSGIRRWKVPVAPPVGAEDASWHHPEREWSLRALPFIRTVKKQKYAESSKTDPRT